MEIIFISLSILFLILFVYFMYNRIKKEEIKTLKLVEVPDKPFKSKPIPKNYVEFLRASKGKKKRAKIYRHMLCKHHFGNFSPTSPI